MSRTAKHNWQKLFLEYGQGRYKNVAEFARKKEINPNQMRDEFRKLGKEQENKTTENNREKQQKTTEKKGSKKRTTENPWERLKKQFTDWPEEKLQAYLIQLEARKAELEAIPFEELSPAEVKELGRVRQERRAILSDPDPEVKCHAHNRDGSPCGNPVERGKKVCWNHGGAPGSGTQPGQQKALKHGLYAKILPDCEEFKAIVDTIEQQSHLDILWQDIVLLQAQITWSQKIMFVTHKGEMIKELKKIKSQLDSNPGYNRDDPDSKPLAEVFREEEWEFQFAWDRQATFLKAQSMAMKTLDGLIARYEEMIQKGNASEEHRLRLEKMKQDMTIARERMDLEKSKVMGDPEDTVDDGFIDALSAKAGEAWDGHTEED